MAPWQVDAIAAGLGAAHLCPAEPAEQGTKARNEVAAAADSPAAPGVERGRTPDGREYVSVTGSAARAESIRCSYEAQGKKTTEVQRDRRNMGAWFFYWE